MSSLSKHVVNPLFLRISAARSGLQNRPHIRDVKRSRDLECMVLAARSLRSAGAEDTLLLREVCRLVVYLDKTRVIRCNSLLNREWDGCGSVSSRSRVFIWSSSPGATEDVDLCEVEKGLREMEI
jgi:hypothetical protein